MPSPTSQPLAPCGTATCAHAKEAARLHASTSPTGVWLGETRRGCPKLTVQRGTAERPPDEPRVSWSLQCHGFAQGPRITAAVSHPQLEVTGARPMSGHDHTAPSLQSPFSWPSTHSTTASPVLELRLADFSSLNKAGIASQEQQPHRKATQYGPALHLLHSGSLGNNARRTQRWEGTCRKTLT